MDQRKKRGGPSGRKKSRARSPSKRARQSNSVTLVRTNVFSDQINWLTKSLQQNQSIVRTIQTGLQLVQLANGLRIVVQVGTWSWINLYPVINLYLDQMKDYF